MPFETRGPIATEDMKNRIAAGWTVSQLWDRFQVAVSGEGFNYDYAEAESNSEVTDSVVSEAQDGIVGVA